VHQDFKKVDEVLIKFCFNEIKKRIIFYNNRVERAPFPPIQELFSEENYYAKIKAPSH
jgi:hypothetical protein